MISYTRHPPVPSISPNTIGPVTAQVTVTVDAGGNRVFVYVHIGLFCRSLCVNKERCTYRPLSRVETPLPAASMVDAEGNGLSKRCVYIGLFCKHHSYIIGL